jgi:hypothetical protein
MGSRNVYVDCPHGVAVNNLTFGCAHMQKGPEGPFLQNDFVATDFYFVAARLTAFAGAAAFGTALAATFAFGATGAGAAAVAGAAFSAVR